MEQTGESDNMTRLLVERAKTGDAEAFDRLFRRATDRLLLFVRLRLGPALREKTESMDILQEAYAEAVRSFGSFEYRGEDSFARWMFRLVENRLSDQRDRFEAAKRRPPEGVRCVEDALEVARASRVGPATLAARAEIRQRLANAMDELEPEGRQAILLRYFEERTIEEIGANLGRSPSAVRRLLARTIRRLGSGLTRTERNQT